ncbi:hypothetical protein BST81_10995 [Leptolyngbya sp. 'hensonii']|uniref:formylglycine-generating enzyme family protein n=1 Tax=Leptolyngbya sp. 'hensonii' TaxID=1922337 RepID=UPI00094FC3F0|nr:formylglycine-generating enzyme family protein [Leptolyngbya sp. 'hensonii']OLP18374.1 hypothetical protein BST81_10995 [Leptolyngbya sp. 'hensonii']
MANETTIPARRIVISRQTHRGQFFTELLDDNTHLEMMLIPGGTFLMGQTEAEKDELVNQVGEADYQKYFTDELPRHGVTVPSFFLGKYPITQAQWRAVAAYPAVEQDLDSAPSHFNGASRPVEQVSWDDATEFCRRLSRQTGRLYRLPSESEWEYACRAGTQTPFHVGDTLSDELANYCAQDQEIDGTLHQGIYGHGLLGQYRQETTEAGQFPANPFGLYDMHGNVWEWCEDDYHNNYNHAPDDGSAWVESDRKETQRVLRGGSWYYGPGDCRSAVRDYGSREGRDDYIGFRVCCVLPGALS